MIRQLECGALRLESHDDGEGAVVVRWFGRSNAREPAVQLTHFIGEAVRRAAQANRTFRMSFESLESYNSTTIAFLVGVVHQARGAGVPVDLTYAKWLRWQCVSFDALGYALSLFGNEQGAPVRVIGIEGPPASAARAGAA